MRARGSWIARLGRLGLWLGLGGAALAFDLGPGRKDAPAARTESRCPARLRRDALREARVLGLLRAVPESRALLERAGGALALCFGEQRPDVVTTDGVLWLAEADERLTAARAAHLLAHLEDGLARSIDGPPAPAGDRGAIADDCPHRVARAMVAEARGLELELRLRQALAAPSPRPDYPFAAEVAAAPPEQRQPLIARYLAAHPHGDGVVDGLVSAYQARCHAAEGGVP